MAFNVEGLRETLNINRSDMVNDRAATNDLIIDDFMVELGYNRKRDKSVKRCYNTSDTNGAIDWEVLTATGSRLAVKVFAIDEMLDQNELDKAMQYCIDKRFSIFIVTNGEALTVCRYRKETNEYTEVCDINLLEDLTDTATKVLEAISKDSFDLQLIDSLLPKGGVSTDKILEIIRDSIYDITDMVVSKINGASDSDREHCKATIEKFFTVKQNVEQAAISDTNSGNNNDELKNELESVKTELNSTKEELTNAKLEITNLREKLIDASENGEQSIDIAEKDAQIKSLKEEVDKLTATMIADDGEKDVKIEELETEVHRLKRKLNSTSIFTTGDESIDSQINSYRDQINDLTIKVANYDEQIADLEAKLKEAHDEINNMSGIERQKAHELLSVIEDNPELDRHYVGVVNTELLQYDEIHTFVGRSLQKLYEIKRLEASQYIFNGDIFKLSQPAIRNDLIMNNKQYDVNFSDIYEDDVLNKLRILFSHFSDVVFECKKIGTLRDKSILVDSAKERISNISLSKDEDITSAEEIAMTDSNENIEEIDNSEEVFNDTSEIDDSYSENELEMPTDDFDEQSEELEMPTDDFDEQAEDDFSEELEMPVDDFDEQSEELEMPADSFDEQSEELEMPDSDEYFDTEQQNIEYSNDSFESSNNAFDNEFNEGFDSNNDSDNWDTTENTDGFDIDDNKQQSYNEDTLLVAQLLQIDNLIWMEDVNIEFKNIKYIGSNSVTFNINKDADDVSNEQLLCKCVDALMAIEAYNGNSGIVAQLKQTDFSEINNFLHLYTDEYRGYPRINGTKYVASNVSTVQSICSILYDICNYMNIDMSEIFIYLTASTDSTFIIENYGYSEDAVQLRDYNEPEINTDNKVVAIIKGDMFNNIVVTKNSLQAHKDIIVDSVAIKTKYLAKILNNEADLVESIEQLLLEASKFGTPNLNAIGNVIGESYKIISDSQFDVGIDPLQIGFNGKTLYMARLENWQILHSLIKMHTTLFGNTAIAIKTVVNADAINFYGQNFETSEPSLSLAVKSFADYVALNVKR